MEGHTQRVFCVDVNDTCVFSGSADKTIKVQVLYFELLIY